MKELTIEQKAKAYDEALERARALNSGKDIDIEAGTTTCEYIFPELKESESERIRKELITHFRNTRCVTEEGSEKIAQWVAWLDNQAEQSTDKIEPNPDWSETDEEMLTWLCRIIHSQRLDRAITLKEESELGKWIDKWLNYNPQTKQCEHLENYDEEERIRKVLLNDFKNNCSEYYCEGVNRDMIIAWLEKQGEQKPVDKVEPKFKVDDWIVFNGLILHIDEVINGYYRTTSIGYGIHNSYDWDIDNIASLWTIQDAKDA